MTLTEEQRAAIHAVSGLLTAIGCPQCHSYLQKNYTHHIEVLRAMTDSSEHFSDATKMIGFDMEKARASIAHYRIENPSNVDTESALKELVDQANLAEDALAEIERLRSAIRTYREREESAFSEIEMKDEFLTRQNARINELEADLEQSERVIEARLEVIDQQATQIRELQAEGKIGPDAETGNRDHVVGPDQMIPNGKCWQITEERVDVLGFCLSGEFDRCGCAECDHAVAVLRAMLEEAL